jgi:hypothetical protein
MPPVESTPSHLMPTLSRKRRRPPRNLPPAPHPSFSSSNPPNKRAPGAPWLRGQKPRVAWFVLARCLRGLLAEVTCRSSISPPSTLTSRRLRRISPRSFPRSRGEAALVPRLPESCLAETLLERLCARGVQTRHPERSRKARPLPSGSRLQRPHQRTACGRANSYMAATRPGMLDWDSTLKGAEGFCWSGVPPSAPKRLQSARRLWPPHVALAAGAAAT